MIPSMESNFDAVVTARGPGWGVRLLRKVAADGKRDREERPEFYRQLDEANARWLQRYLAAQRRPS